MRKLGTEKWSKDSKAVIDEFLLMWLPLPSKLDQPQESSASAGAVVKVAEFDMFKPRLHALLTDIMEASELGPVHAAEIGQHRSSQGDDAELVEDIDDMEQANGERHFQAGAGAGYS
ncbi:unnamed protein product [Symbiodinium natans]|uniref:Uncharacterized protein n=1 Tax=Symbiodinium natans TaxID=878477 RepID=A0A812RQB9_9DINO|nr:unnamed protein product [Symbiodinium natans]